ncbi:flagellar protein FlgN [Bacillus sp. FJAT-27245]|uniref:flagellar protein FlgN n=1 Tax=Bacillus sp. FJAT-27245 TaxID=1684144 RepID=UPI0006A7BF3D|nr:flagellar protein FlgN [Bacillus sp. FJAT-27245]
MIGALEEKLAQLKRFGAISDKLLDALQNGRNEEIDSLLEERETCISSIGLVEKEAGSPLIDYRIKALLSELAAKEKQLDDRFKEILQKMTKSIRDVRREQYVTRQYDDWLPVTEGYFYDKKS